MEELKLSGSDFDLTAFWEDVLAFSAASHDSAMDLSGNGGTWWGYINAPNGRIKIAGSSNFTVAGSLIADRVTVSSTNFNLDSTQLAGQDAEPGGVRLAE